jgi:hypothetical protein
MEVYQFLLLSAVSEIYYYQDAKLYSLFFAFIVVVFCIAFFAAVSLISGYYDYDPKNFSKTQEFYTGLKPVKETRIYTVFILLRRLVLVVWLIAMSSFDKYAVISFAILVQVIYLVFMVYSRPFELLENNIVELTNEVFFTFLLTALWHLNTKEKWTRIATDVYMFVLMGNNIVIAMILFSKRANFNLI